MPQTANAPRLAYLLEDQERMSRAQNYFAWQGRLVLRELGQRVIEVGCGLGNFTGMLLDRELVVPVDLEADCVERLQQRYPHSKDIHAFVCGATDPDFRSLARFQPDSCVCLNVLEHIEDDCGALRAMAGLLPAGGVIVLLVPAFLALYGPTDRNLGHYRRYDRRSLRKLAEAAGLHVKKLRYMNAVGFFGWWANARIWKREANSEAQIAFFDRFVAPWLSTVEDVVPSPFGQSLFAVLQK